MFHDTNPALLASTLYGLMPALVFLGLFSVSLLSLSTSFMSTMLTICILVITNAGAAHIDPNITLPEIVSWPFWVVSISLLAVVIYGMKKAFGWRFI